MKRLAASFCFALVLTPGAAFAQSKLFLQEVFASPTEAESIAIVNPGSTAVVLTNYYLSDYASYYQLVTSTATTTNSDFIVQFPAGASIQPGEKQYVALAGAECFRTACNPPDGGVYLGFGFYPSYEFPTAAQSASVPDMLAPFTGAIGTGPGLTNGGEPVILFYWDGASDKVVDIDYVYYNTTGTNTPVNKTGVSIDGPDSDTTASSYGPDSTDVPANHVPTPTTGIIGACRTSLNEGQLASGSNGIGGTDETSENWSTTWAVCSITPVDGGVPDAGTDASAGGTAGAATGGTAGASTGGTAGASTGGTAGAATGGTAGTAGAAGGGAAGAAGAAGGGAAGAASGGTSGGGGTGGSTGGGGGTAGSGAKGGTGGLTDAGTDAGYGSGGGSGGCGCSTPGAESGARAFGAGLLVALGLLARRRRRNR